MRYAKGVLQLLVLSFAVFILSLPSLAVDRTRLISFNDSWQSASSWSPSGVPSGNDRAFIENGLTVRLSADTDAVNDLVISNGSGLRTNGFQLNVADSGGFAQTLIQGAGSWVRVNPRTAGGAALNSNEVIIFNGGLLDMFGGEADVDFKLDINAGGTVAGDGMVTISDMLPSGEPGPELNNNGTIRAEGGTLTIASTGGGSLELDGNSNAGVLEAVDGVATLIIDDSETFAGTMNIGTGNTIQFNQTWSTSIGTINFGNISGGVSMLSGSPYEHRGTMNVNAGTAKVLAQIEFDSNGIINLTSEDVALHLENDATVDAGASFTGNGMLVNLDGAALSPAPNVDIGVSLENRGLLRVAGANQANNLEVEEFEQTSTGILEIELADIAPQIFDVLTVQGNATLGGALDVELFPNVSPVVGTSFTILETVSGNVSGTFDTENVPTFDGRTFDVIYNSNSVALQVVEAVDLDDDGDVDGTDFLLIQRTDPSLIPAWEAAYGDVVPLSASQAVPEPSGGALLSIVVVAAHLKRRR